MTVSELRLGKGLGIQASRLGGYATLCFMLCPPPVSDVSCPEDHYDCILRLPGTSQFAKCFLLHFILFTTVGNRPGRWYFPT